jgi:hypothetical protein
MRTVDLIVSTHCGVVPSACWVFGLGRIRAPAAFARFAIIKLACGEKVEHTLE